MTRLERSAPVIGAALLYGVAVPWVFRSWFLTADLIPHTPGAVGAMIDADLYLNIWILAWIAHAALFDPAQLLDGNIFHPALNTIAGSENMLAHVPFTAPALAISGSALTMLKVYVFESFVLSGLGMFLYVRHHTKSDWAALVAGAVYTFTPFRVETIPQPQYLGMAWLPLALLAVDLHLEDGRKRWLVAFAGALVLQALSCVYIGFFAFILCPVYVLVRAIGTSHEGTGWIAPTTRLAFSMIGAAIVLIPAALPYLHARSEGMIPAHDLVFIQAASWAPSLFFSKSFLFRAGAVTVGLVALGFVFRVLRGSPRPADGERPGPATALWVVALVASVLAAGPYLALSETAALPLPYVALYELVPGFSSIRVPIRFILIVAACLAALAGLAFARLARDRSGVAAGISAVLLTGMAVFASAPRPQPAMAAHLDPAHSEAYRWLAAQPGSGAVLEIPGQSTEQDVIGNIRNGRYMVGSTIHWRPILNGYTAYPPPSAGFYSAAIRELPDARALQLLVETSDLEWILVHRGALTPQEAVRWPREAPPGLEHVATFGDTEVFAVKLERKRDWRREVDMRMTGATDSLYRTTLAPLAPACRRGSLTVDAPVRIPPFPLARRVPVVVRNESDCVWPAAGLLEAGLVGLDYLWIPPEGAPETDQLPVPFFRLLADIPPAGEEPGAVMLWPPKGAPGLWTLEVRLRQMGVAEPIATARRPIEVRAAKNPT